MYWIIKTNGNLAKGNYSDRAFERFALVEDLEAYSDKGNDSVEDLLKQADLLSWIVTKNGRVAKGSNKSVSFVRYATKTDLKDIETDGVQVKKEPKTKKVKESKEESK
jgi:hypothetical protein